MAETTAARPGTDVTVALVIDHDPGWHTYWKNPGDSGMPTRIAWTLPDGVTAGAIAWPAPKRLPVGPLANYGYDGEVLLLTTVSVPRTWPTGTPLALRAKADWLVCQDVCLPGGQTLTLDLPVQPGAAPTDPQWGARIAATRAALPAPARGWTVTARPDGADVVLTLAADRAAGAPSWPATGAPAQVWFFPEAADVIDHAATPRASGTVDGTLELRVAGSAQFAAGTQRIAGVLVADGTDWPAITVEAAWPGGRPTPSASPASPTTPAMSAADIRAATDAPPASPVSGAWAALGLAFVGGLILNLMPCVFPVVSIKVLGFVRDAGGAPARARAHALAFAAGIVVSFWVVAGGLLMLRAGGEALGWGYQLQSPPVVALLAALFFVLGLNLSGVFEWGGAVQAVAGRAASGGGLAGAFGSGLLATAVATPCTAPLMGAALGWALTQPAIAALAVFTALALGMAAPYVVLAFTPALAARMPRPGRWMETLKQFLAFPLYLTVVWLVWVLAEQSGAGAAARLLAALVLVAAALWAWQRFADPGRTRGVARAVAAAFAVAAIGVGWPAAQPQAAVTAPAGDWAAWTRAAEDTLVAQHRAVFVDYTAAWCVTCQVNKRVVLETDAVRAAFARTGVVRLRADWTRRDPDITAALARLDRSGVPVYVVHPADGSAPIVLPEVLTRDAVIAALERAAPAR
ncbi:MAG: thioredoxin family protein [Burkholderiales bacterium]|nr:thioredoxin family protein [Burkholderiales bacterium]